MNEVKIRVPTDFHRAINLAAARRGVPASALVATAIHEYLRERGELAPTQAAPKPAIDPDDLREWFEDDDA